MNYLTLRNEFYKSIKISNFNIHKKPFMKKILVTTDFSPASKSAVRFAIHWATHQKLSLVFANVCHISMPVNQDEAFLEAYTKQFLAKTDEKLKIFIKEIYNDLKIDVIRINTLTIEGIDPTASLLYYVTQNPIFDCICISTRGAGNLKKFLGTNTGNLITKSEIPVMAIPSGYAGTNIDKVLYATDMNNFEEEVHQVISFAKPLKAKIEMVHFAWPSETFFDEATIVSPFKKHFKYGIEFQYQKHDAVHSLVQNLERQIAEKKPSVVVMFTKQERTFFQKLFLSSKSEEFSFKTKIPLLVFKKAEKDNKH
jgi:nucleotide-binding universal stress UspA family protein